VSRIYSQTAFPAHECGRCGKHQWGVVKFFASDYSDHRKVGCMACHASDVYHPDDSELDMFGELTRGRPIHVRLQKAWADEQGIFMVVGSSRGEFLCMVRGCDSREVQHHHYAPKVAFGMRAEAFGTVPLCRLHHEELHETIRLHINRGGKL
jgi:hypothetical protein